MGPVEVGRLYFMTMLFGILFAFSLLYGSYFTTVSIIMSMAG